MSDYYVSLVIKKICYIHFVLHTPRSRLYRLSFKPSKVAEVFLLITVNTAEKVSGLNYGGSRRGDHAEDGAREPGLPYTFCIMADPGPKTDFLLAWKPYPSKSGKF